MLELVPYQDLATALVVDLTVLTVCTVLLLYYGRLAHSHPAVVYLLFHALVVPSRLLAIMAGADTWFTNWGGIFEGVTEEEIVRAAFLFDVTLAVMTVAWMRTAVVDARHGREASAPADNQPRTLSLEHIWRVVAIAFPIGIIGIGLLGYVPGIEKPEIDFGDWQESSWLSITMTWAGLALLALIYWYGLRWWLLVLMTCDLFVMAVQGYHRFRVIIPLILILQIYLDRRGRRWPPAIVLVPIVVGVMLFYPMKTIGRMAQEGASIADISRSSSEIVREAMSGQAADQSVLDQLASSLTLIDRADKYYYGSIYLVLFTSPVPRQWWPDKPTLSSHLQDISTPSRPVAELGMILTFIGEFYINFGYFGIIFMSYLTAYWLARVYFRAYRSNYFSVLRFGYLLIACNLIQVYRDGLMSLFIFTLVNMMPLAAIVILHYVWPVRQNKASVPLYRMPVSPR
ncbi:MAG TPA: O-antigen polymerase [Blastocatellia bacterium]|nr:O-antigen polymerase [Blastocatellia bacterium]